MNAIQKFCARSARVKRLSSEHTLKKYFIDLKALKVNRRHVAIERYEIPTLEIIFIFSIQISIIIDFYKIVIYLIL